MTITMTTTMVTNTITMVTITLATIHTHLKAFLGFSAAASNNVHMLFQNGWHTLYPSKGVSV